MATALIKAVADILEANTMGVTSELVGECDGEIHSHYFISGDNVYITADGFLSALMQELKTRAEDATSEAIRKGW